MSMLKEDTRIPLSELKLFLKLNVFFSASRDRIKAISVIIKDWYYSVNIVLEIFPGEERWINLNVYPKISSSS